MTGGGNIVQGHRVTHGFILQCDADEQPNSLQVNWNRNRFHLESLDTATCTDDSAIEPFPPAAEFDTYRGTGTGSYNGDPGATAQWTFTDAGEPGRDDWAQIIITDANGNVVLSISGNLNGGNHQAHGQANPPLLPPPTQPAPIHDPPSPTHEPLLHEPLLKVHALEPTPTAQPVTGLPSAGIGELDPGDKALTPWLVLGATLVTSGATLSLGAQLTRQRRTRRHQVSDNYLLPAGRQLRIRMSPVADFHAFVDALHAVTEIAGVAQAKAVHLGNAEALFEVTLDTPIARDALAQAVSDTLQRATYIQLAGTGSVEDRVTAA